jgi:ssDNA-binding Zn-finger/Zn-ribbon topoisomerase 1
MSKEALPTSAISIIEKAADKSEKTCEICGKPGRVIFADEYFVRCEKCLNSKYL